MAASRAALLGLAALLALQHSSSGSDSPELSSHNHSAPLETHHNRQHALSHRSRSVPQMHESYRSHKNLLGEMSSPELHASEDEAIKKKSRRREGGISTNVDEVEVESASYVGGGHSSTVLNMPPRPGTYIPSNCSSCHIREELKNISLQTIKEQVLHKLGMKHAPNMTGRSIPKIPPLHHLLEAYGMQSDQPDRYFQPGMTIHEEEDDYHAKTTMVIVVAQTTKLRHGGGIGTDLDIQHFRFSEHSIRNKVAGGSLFVFVPATNRPMKVRVYRVIGNATEHQSMTILNTASSKLSEHRKPGWVELETPKLLMDWFKNPQDNLGVVIKLEDDSGHLMPYVVDTHDHNGESKQPFVRVYTTDGRKHRNKRTIGLNCHENSQESRCCRYPLTVDFEEFGWDWIIAPKKYDANYCSGECPYVFLQKYPHTHIVQQANPTGTAGPCCAPRKMSPISMLYFDSEFNIIYGLLPGMVVDRCGCQ